MVKFVYCKILIITEERVGILIKKQEGQIYTDILTGHLIYIVDFENSTIFLHIVSW